MIAASVEVIRAGARTSIERATRGQAHLGVSVGGPFDTRAALRANRLVGNRDDAAVLEMTLLGPTLRFLVDTRIAIAGPLTIADGVVDVRAGQTVTLGACMRGARAALSIRGGFAGQGVVTNGQVLAVARDVAARARPAPSWQLPDDMVLRVTEAPHSPGPAPAPGPGPGPGPGPIAQLVERPWIVSPTSDRAGVRLDGEPLAARPEIASIGVSIGVSVGAVQLPPSGQPVVLGVDRATTGGYPVIAHVATVDRWLLAQLRPATTLRFAHVTIEEAIRLARREHAARSPW